MIALRRGRRETSLPPKSIVLVHGGFFDGSVYHILKKHGFEVIVVQNPTIPLANDVAVTKQTIAAAKGDVVLVGLSLRRRRCVGGGQRFESHRLDLVRMKRSPRNYRDWDTWIEGGFTVGASRRTHVHWISFRANCERHA